MKGKSSFTVKEAYDDLEKKCPGVCKMLKNVAGPKANNARILGAASLLLNCRNRRISHFQKLIGLLLWKGQLRSLVRYLVFRSYGISNGIYLLFLECINAMILYILDQGWEYTFHFDICVQPKGLYEYSDSDKATAKYGTPVSAILPQDIVIST